MSASAEYAAWQNAKNRCERKEDIRYVDYGGRGIQMKFRTFEDFFAAVGPRPPGLTLDRIDTDGHYEVGNVQWATPRAQARNRRTSRMIEVGGIKRNLTEWAEIYGQPPQRVSERLRAGWDALSALTCPKGQDRAVKADALALLCWSVESL